jgi:hypothetical protein
MLTSSRLLVVAAVDKVLAAAVALEVIEHLLAQVVAVQAQNQNSVFR